MMIGLIQTGDYAYIGVYKLRFCQLDICE